MKKTYINPNMVVVNLKMQHQLLAGSDQGFGPLGNAKNADESTRNGGWNSRRGGFLDDDED